MQGPAAGGLPRHTQRGQGQARQAGLWRRDDGCIDTVPRRTSLGGAGKLHSLAGSAAMPRGVGHSALSEGVLRLAQ